MRRGSTVFLQVVILLIGILAATLLIIEPTKEGANAHRTLFQIYFTDPFIAYIYLGSIAFFIALYKAIRLLGYVRRGEVFSQQSVKALRTIRHCAITLIGFLLGAEAFILIVQRSKSDDIAGGVMMGLILTFFSVVVATTAALIEKTLQSAVDLKSENDLTV